MLASITPLGERGRRSRWGITVSAFLLGAMAAGGVAGALLGALGSLAPPIHARLAVLLAAIVVAVVLDARDAVPGPRRQVNERWLDRYRGWVYGAGYGAQLGFGVATIVSSAATYVALLAAFLTASVPAGAVVLGCFGAVRGMTPLAAAGVRSQRQLFGFHRALARWRSPVRWGAVAAQAGMLAAALLLS